MLATAKQTLGEFGSFDVFGLVHRCSACIISVPWVEESITKPKMTFPHFREDENKNIWIPAFAGMTEDEGQFCYKL
jgi:hypothetical protein